MTKAQRLSEQLEKFEAEYRAVLKQALLDCADGRWGLFGHNEHLYTLGIPAELTELRELADSIDRVRARIGEQPFPLHAEFEAARRRSDANAPGEPKQAQAWLLRLGEG